MVQPFTGVLLGRVDRLSDFSGCELLFWGKSVWVRAWYVVRPLQVGWPIVRKELIDAFEPLERDGFVGVNAGEGCAAACG
ncbi:MAG: hypothetical protein KUG61_00405 [Parvibaculaceae bacterium]|nr:hypothetical protein [Parvibaculaceae bacterium]